MSFRHRIEDAPTWMKIVLCAVLTLVATLALWIAAAHLRGNPVG